MRICTLRDIEVHIAGDGTVNAYSCSPAGESVGEPLRTAESTETFEIYQCVNCGGTKKKDGFTMREHLGKMHNFIDPFLAV